MHSSNNKTLLTSNMRSKEKAIWFQYTGEPAEYKTLLLNEWNNCILKE